MTVLAVVGLFVAAVSRVGPPSPDPGDSVWVSRDSIDRLNDRVTRLDDNVNSLGDSIDVLLDRLEIGFVPCWRRSGAGGYYFTYDLTYENNSYHFGIHLDFDTAVDALGVDDGLVLALTEFPRGPVNADEISDFGEQLGQATATAYPDRSGCKLAVTLNRGATGHEISVITQAGLYPIYRD